MKKNRSPKFQYRSLKDPKYLSDRRDLFREHGNGWWFLYGIDKRKGSSRLA